MSNSGFFFLMVFAYALAIVARAEARQARPMGSRAFFVFGDSLVDFGNNNYIKSLARADRLPYGIDTVDGKPTGRFSNGLNIADLVAEEFGMAPILAYLNPDLNGTKLLAGANFASAGVGILNETGSQFRELIRIHDQLKYFQDYQARVSELVGPEKAQQLVKQSLTLIVLGGNDFINNYFYRPALYNPFSPSMLRYSLPNFVSMLVSEYHKILMRMHELGAGRVIVTSTGPMGCAPGEKAQSSFFGECASFPQLAADLYNPQLREMIQRLNQELGSQVFTFANTIGIHNDFINNPQAFGFVTSANACCGQGPYNGMGFCSINSTLCPNRNDYVFWDAFHPTEKANRLIVKQLVNATTQHMDPMNLNTIMTIDSQF